MAKIRLYRTKGGGRGWSVPYKWNGIALRKFTPIGNARNPDNLRSEEAYEALKSTLEAVKPHQNGASELGRID